MQHPTQKSLEPGSDIKIRYRGGLQLERQIDMLLRASTKCYIYDRYGYTALIS